jgi:hypothetical protein
MKSYSARRDAIHPTQKVVYDFETGFFPEGNNFKATTNLKADAERGAITYVAGTDAYNTALETLGKNSKATLINAYLLYNRKKKQKTPPLKRRFFM